MNETKTLPNTVIFISPDETQENEIVIRSPAPPSYILSDKHLLTIKLSEVAGQPIKAWKVIPEFSHGRVVAMQFEVYPYVDPLLPIPIIEAYPERFVTAMRQFARHLARWSFQDEKQQSWFRSGQVMIEDIITASYRLQLLPGERIAFESCLKYALAKPGEFSQLLANR